MRAAALVAIALAVAPLPAPSGRDGALAQERSRQTIEGFLSNALRDGEGLDPGGRGAADNGEGAPALLDIPSDDAPEAGARSMAPPANPPGGEADAAGGQQAVSADDTRPGARGEGPSASDMAFGAFQRGFYLTARDRALPLAKLGDPAAQTLLGEIYSRGLGVARDGEEAARWYAAAAGAGDPAAQFRLAMMIVDGDGITRDGARARDLMEKAADAGLPLAQFNYGQMLIQSSPAGGFRRALPYFRRAAEAGVADAQYAMGQLYAYGRGVDTDASEARRWLKQAAGNGHETARIEYGIWLLNGKGGEAAPRDGFGFLRQAARGGNPIAINRLAHLYLDGIGTEQDDLAAAQWIILAKRVKNSDGTLDRFFGRLDAETRKSALERANRFQAG